MEREVELVSPHLNLNKFQDEDYSHGYQNSKVLQQQWVTLTASMWPEPTASTRGFKASSERIPILVAVFCGAAIVVCLLFALVLYKCCVMPRREKIFCTKKIDTKIPTSQTHQMPITNQSAIYAENKGKSWGYINRLVTPVQGSPWYVPRMGGPQCTQCPGICPVPRSVSNPGTSNQPQNLIQTNTNTSSKRQRPVSQPVHFGTSNLAPNGDVPKAMPIPEICEFSPSGCQYASSSILDEVATIEEESASPLKTRSLPAWVRSKPRPLSTEDDLNDLYAKVNFSKKRKNRMRNDEAAIIALSKSRSQFFHKDTDSLVDNEAVIVYDERTAL